MLWLTAALTITMSVMLWFAMRTNQVYSIRSGSMEPVIPTGSLVFIHPSPSKIYAIGDIVTYDYYPYPITHRIIATKSTNETPQYLTQGDANATPDQNWITATDILGKLSVTIPWGGYFLAWLKTKTGFTIVILAPATLVIMQEVYAMKKAWSELKRRFKNSPSLALLLLMGSLLTTSSASATLSSSATLTKNHVRTHDQFPTESTNPCAVTINSQTSNINTGPNSTNKNSVQINTDCEHEENYSSTIKNDTQVNAATGNNAVN